MGDRQTDPRARILVAAERLFAERGIASVSLREIGAAAGHRNNSAVQYHFGTKEGLVRALYEYRLAPLNRRRLELLSELEAVGRPDAVRPIVEAYVRPLAEAASSRHGTSYYARFVSRYLHDDAMAEALTLDASVVSGVRRVMDLLEDQLADLPAAVRHQRIAQCRLLVTGVLADHERRRGHDGEGSPPTELVTACLVDACCALLTGPVSGPTRVLVDELADE